MNTEMRYESNYYSRSKSRERRKGQGYPFTAQAAVIDVASNTRIQARTSDIDRGGCFVDTMNSFGIGTIVMLHLTRQNRSFKAKVKVVYSEIGVGMCLAFTETDFSELCTLEQWLAELSGEETSLLRVAKQNHQVVAGKPVERDAGAAVKYLIFMLMQKKILSDTEGSALLEKMIA